MKALTLATITFCLLIIIPTISYEQNLQNNKGGTAGKMRIIQEVKPDGSVWMVVLGGYPPYTFSVEGTGYWFEHVEPNGVKTKTKKVVQNSDRIRMYGIHQRSRNNESPAHR